MTVRQDAIQNERIRLNERKIERLESELAEVKAKIEALGGYDKYLVNLINKIQHSLEVDGNDAYFRTAKVCCVDEITARVETD